MCTRTKTTYGCGHSHKVNASCHESRCPGLERFHFEHAGDCAECKNLTQAYVTSRSGKVSMVDRGKMGLGRYGKELRRREQEDEEQSAEELEYIRPRRGRSTVSKTATGAAESSERRKALRTLKQTEASGHQYRAGGNLITSKPSRPYQVVSSQPLPPSLPLILGNNSDNQDDDLQETVRHMLPSRVSNSNSSYYPPPSSYQVSTRKPAYYPAPYRRRGSYDTGFTSSSSSPRSGSHTFSSNHHQRYSTKPYYHDGYDHDELYGYDHFHDREIEERLPGTNIRVREIFPR